MSSELGYYRHPAIWKNDIVFVCEDDLWKVSADGGIARRLTANPGVAAFPAFSPDGKSVAFTGRDDGPSEVYVIPSEGGPPDRLSWLGAQTHVVGWNGSGTSVLASTDWRQPFAGTMHLISVGTSGTAPECLPYGLARAISFCSGSKSVTIGRNSGDPARWKRYRGGTAGTIWVDRKGQGKFSQLIKLRGNLANPMWIGTRIYFLSDHEGNGNIYSCTPNGRGLKRHTNHSDFYVRFPSSDGLRIVYHAGADIYIFDPVSNESKKVDIKIHSSRSQQNRKFVGASRYLESFDLHPKGHTLATIHRGGLFSSALWEGASLRFGAVSRIRYRLAKWLSDGNRIIAITDEGGEEQLIIFPADLSGAAQKIKGDFGRTIEIFVAPGMEHINQETDEKADQEKKSKKRTKKKSRGESDLIALTNNRHELILVDLLTGKSKVIDRSPHHRIAGVDWSPDSRWLAYGHSSSEKTCSIRLYNVETHKVTILTNPDFFDVDPSFDPAGKYLYFVSWRVFNPVYDSHYFDLGFPEGARPHLITLQEKEVSPFSAATRLPRPPGESSTELDKEEPGEDKILRVDLKGIKDRVIAFPVPEGRYSGVIGTHGRALFSKSPIEGSLHRDNDDTPEENGILEFWDFEANKSGRVSDKVSGFSLSLDRKVLCIRSGNHLRVLPALYKEDPEKNKDEYSRETGWIDLERIPVEVIPSDEWKQMYGEAWRLQRDQFWRPDMSGVDWNGIYDRYLSCLDRVASRTEFSDLMWEVQGELGTSHCYEMGGDYRPRPNWSQGFLGADLEFHRRTKRWRINRIPKGDSWSNKYSSPLSAPGLNLSDGDEILAISGKDLDGLNSPYEQLVNMAGKEIQLTVRNRSRTANPKTQRNVTVKALTEETSLRYRDWVERNRHYVHEETAGRVGYVHIPDMGAFGYSEFHRYYGRESVRDGLIVDVRFNRGGHVSQLLLEKLLRKRIGYDVSRWAEPTPYPDSAPMGPMVAISNEYAGSDGDIFCHAFKLFGLGPLVGKRTWGGVIGIWPRAALVDGTITTQPEYASWFEDVGYGVENYGTDPDIEVDILPQDHAAGRDTQMGRAIVEMRKLLRKSPRIPKLKKH